MLENAFYGILPADKCSICMSILVIRIARRTYVFVSTAAVEFAVVL